METVVAAPCSGTIKRVAVNVGDNISPGELTAEIDENFQFEKKLILHAQLQKIKKLLQKSILFPLHWQRLVFVTGEQTYPALECIICVVSPCLHSLLFALYYFFGSKICIIFK